MILYTDALSAYHALLTNIDTISVSGSISKLLIAFVNIVTHDKWHTGRNLYQTTAIILTHPNPTVAGCKLIVLILFIHFVAVVFFRGVFSVCEVRACSYYSLHILYLC